MLVGFRDADQITTTLTSLGDPLREDEIAEIITLGRVWSGSVTTPEDCATYCKAELGTTGEFL